MRGEASSDVLKVWLYAAAVVISGAWLAPLLYNAGKALAEISAGKQTNVPLEWLAKLCQRADFPGFFTVSLWVCALILFLLDTGLRATELCSLRIGDVDAKIPLQRIRLEPVEIVGG